MEDTTIGGIDEAGRGALIGPLVIAGVSIESSKIDLLRNYHVKDSKVLLPSTRNRLYDLIVSTAKKVYVVEVSPKEIDEYVLHGKKLRKLNYLESLKMAKIVDVLEAEVVYVDSADVNPDRFAQEIYSASKLKPKIVAEHHADQNYVVVSAASVVAKVTRDRRIEELASRYGFFGSGYPSDPRTMKFLEDWIRARSVLPDFVRKSWKSLKKVGVKKIDEY
ncbi:MAG: ribonuclease HII [Nitrososphaeria archaeon]